ncbi:uncharacterized protein LOC132705714 [Cylas formicarius]|uniref:uncharacterized protein LOC132705714 n=1 Tax=Cylas formicarius TaxID=197179 RepID=UPI00295837A7|nr:uncharacterized protein LOC132705714 [Cylas formicarius]
MNIFVAGIAICSLLGPKASASHYGSGQQQQQLEGIPDLSSFGKISYPKYDILDLGEYSHDHVPGPEIKITKESKITIPQPYPVKIPVPQPYPVHVPKPYPVEHTKLVKVPVPVPQVIEKKVPYPVEVPKPYPVPVHQENHGGYDNNAQQIGGYGGGVEHQQALEGGGYGVQEDHGAALGEADYGGGSLSSYDAKALEDDVQVGGVDNKGWTPLDGGEGGDGQYH